jgi:hypothetical protein
MKGLRKKIFGRHLSIFGVFALTFLLLSIPVVFLAVTRMVIEVQEGVVYLWLGPPIRLIPVPH